MKQEAFAEYKHKDGKVYLRRNGWEDFREVELVKNKKWWRVKEVKTIPLTRTLSLL